MLRRFPGWALAAALLLFALLGLLPTWFARVGVLAVFVLSLLALTGIVAGAGVIAQRYQPAEVFQRLRLRSTPVLTLLLVAVLFAGTVGAATPIHAVRSGPSSTVADRTAVPAPDPRPELGDAVQTWADRQAGSGCGRSVEVGSATVEVLPMVLIAAEGGGIRAAYWTVQAVQPLRADACANQATLFSSGVSGGAVGLAVQRYNQNPTDVVRAMSNSRALSVGLIGLFVRDFAYAATGVPLPDLIAEHPLVWVDRAGLMEDAWNDAAAAPGSWQDRDFVTTVATPGATLQTTVGPVVLNSMSVGNACRVWVSELRLRPGSEDVAAGGGGKIGCDQPGVAGLRSVDLLSAYGAATTRGSAEVNRPPAPEPYDGCLFGVSVATAAMLAARFPYVTPSGRVGPCVRDSRPSAPVDQLVDGGYLENTGLGAINDLSDVWLPAVQAWNAEHASRPRPQVVVPLVVYLSSDSGSDQRAPQRDLTGEALLPALAKLRAGSGAVTDDTTRQRSADLVAADRVCPPADAVCPQAVESVPRRSFLVYPSSKPQIAAPLGWILSDSSRRSMDSAIADQVAVGCADPTLAPQVDVVCDRGFGTLRDLLLALGR